MDEISKASAIESTVFDIAKLLVKNPKNQLIVYSRFLEFLQDEKESNVYKEYKEYVDCLDGNLFL